MKRFLVKPMTSLAFLMLISSCGGSSNTAPTTTSSTSLAPTTVATTLPATTTTTKKPPVTTKAPTTTTKPKIPTGTPEELADMAAISFGNAVDDAARYGDYAPVFKTIWNTYAAAGMTISIPVPFRISNPTGKPGFAGAYEISGFGQVFCLIYTGGSNYVKNSGAC